MSDLTTFGIYRNNRPALTVCSCVLSKMFTILQCILVSTKALVDSVTAAADWCQLKQNNSLCHLHPVNRTASSISLALFNYVRTHYFMEDLYEPLSPWQGFIFRGRIMRLGESKLQGSYYSSLAALAHSFLFNIFCPNKTLSTKWVIADRDGTRNNRDLKYML